MVTHIKKALSMTLVLAMIFMLFQGIGFSAYAAGDPIFSVETTVDETAGTVVLVCSVANNPGISEFQLWVNYNTSVLEYDVSSLIADSFFAAAQTSVFTGSSKLEVDVYKSTDYEIFSANGELFRFAFKIKDNVPPDTYTINFISDTCWYGESDDPYYTTIAPIEFTIGDVESTVYVDEIQIPSSLTIKIGKTAQLTATIEPEEPTNPVLEWKTTDRGIANVDQTGLVTAYAPGEVTITATAMDSAGVVSNSCTVTVVPSVTDVNFYINDASNGSHQASVPLAALSPEEPFPLYPAFSPPDVVGLPAADKTGVYEVWKSSAPDIVTVDQSGLVTAGSEPGWAFVKFTANDDDGGRYYAVVLFCVLDPSEAGDPAASVDGTDYPTLSAAVAVGAGKTITLLRDQEAGVLTLPEGSTLDLNGHMLYASQVLIPENTAVVSIENGTIIGKHTGNLNNIQQNLPAVTLSDNSSLESLSNVKIMCAQKTPVGGVSGGNIGWTLGSLTDCDITAIFSDPKDGTGVFATPEEKEGLAYLQATLSAALGASGNGDYLYIGGDTRVNVIGGTLIDNGYGEVFIYGGEFDVPRIKTGSTVVHIYGGKYRSAINESAMSNGDEIYGVTQDGEWWVVAVGGTPTDLTLDVVAANSAATVTLYELDGDTELGTIPETLHTSNSFVFPVRMKSDYKYVVTAAGYDTMTGYISITSKNRVMTVTLRAETAQSPGAGGEHNEPINGGYVITEGGTYYLAAPPANRARFGVVTVATRDPVTIVGRGIGKTGHEGERLNTVNADVMYNDLVIDSCAGANLTIKDVWTNNSKGQGTDSGATNLGYTALNFTGKGNTLTIEGVNLLENQEYVSSACIHVPKGAELTFEGTGTLYLYKYTSGAGIGGNANEACGRLTFNSGTYYIKGSKTGAVIGGDLAKGGTNDDITFSGATVVVINVATGGAIGDSNQGHCAGRVYMTDGSLTIYTDYVGPGIGKAGTLIYTGGSLKTEMSYNAYKVGYKLNDVAVGPYIFDNTIMAAKEDGNGNPVSRLVFDTRLLKNQSAPYSATVNGAASAVPSVHNVDWIDSDNTVGNFGLYLTPNDKYYDSNLYFYLPKVVNQALTVNGEEFTVSWNDLTKSFEVKPGAPDPGATYMVYVDPTITGGAVEAGKSPAKGDDTITLTVTPNDGNRLKIGSLKVNGTAIYLDDGEYSFIMPADDVTVTATFESIDTQYDVTITQNTGGTVAVDKPAAKTGETVTLTVTPDGGYRYESISIYASAPVNVKLNSLGGGRFSFVMPGVDVSVSAVFAVDYSQDTGGSRSGTGDISAAVWDGKSIDVSWYNPSASSYTISTPAQLAGLAALVNGLYNAEIDTIYDPNAYLTVTEVRGAASSGSNNQSTSTYHYGATDFAGKTVYITANINMGAANYMPIGGQYLMTPDDTATRVDASFCGVLDGGGHTITINCDRHTDGLYGDGQSVGLIGRLGVHDNEKDSAPAGAVGVRNVAVRGTVYANRSVGGIVGKIGKTNSTAFIENCANFADVTATDAKGVGGICGAAWNDGRIDNCYNAGNITLQYAGAAAGGIAGSVEIPITNCFNVGSVTAAQSRYAMAIGTNNGGGTIENCFYLETSAAGGGWYNGSQNVNDGAKDKAGLIAAVLGLTGGNFAPDNDAAQINNGYPILAWQGGAKVDVTPPATDNSKETDKPETAAKTETTVKDGEATVVVAVPDKDAQTGGEPERLVVNVDTKGENIDKITVEIPKEVIALESGSKSEIEIRSEVANILLPEKAIAALAVTGEAVTVKAAKNDDASYTFTVAAGEKSIEKLDGGIKAVIPAEDVSPGTVAILVHADGTEEVIKKSVGKDGKVSIPLDGSATIKIVDNAKAFSDVTDDAWYSDGVKFTSSHELFQGTDYGGFAPEMSMTRGMLATVLHRLENAPNATGELFSDVAGDAYYAEAIIWASANSIVNGTGDGFAPDAEINREQLTVMLYRYYVWFTVGDGVLDVPSSGTLDRFPDAGNVSDWAEDAVIWAVGVGLINGRDSGLAPQGTATRAEVAVILERFIENVL